ncbi:NAD(P)H-dependent glycerol-3-phosphate dehydrogenase [Oscillibacter sp.]|uniref:NAD(P)H-dependent glycerol-3-phosphate dehydrogenase n=1 Tax=Oscillibacter sp. TaxID=1945593 RepID=UPI00257C13F9|nr:NAD(P)H-dependent glycerol-3-phosphate dehydrogenase [Oscillibacter sp.]
MKTVVLGSGGWGTALSQILCDNGHETYLWSHSPAKAAEMARTRENPLLQGVHLPESLHITGDLGCLRGADLVVSAPPSFAVRETAKKMAPYLTEKTVVVSVSKGIERDTNLRLSQVIQEETGNICKVAVLSGPSHAEEVGIRLPTGCVAACLDVDAARFVQDAFMNDYFRVYTSGDVVGVELAAALKNVIALSCGVCDGLGYQDNTKALMMTRAMAEITRLGSWGLPADLRRLGRYGDLIVTCTSMHSRNRRAGILIGQGKTPREAMEEVGAVVEGYFAAESIHQLSERVGVGMPISRCAYELLYQGKQIRGVVAELMTRPRRMNCWRRRGCEVGTRPFAFLRREKG